MNILFIGTHDRFKNYCDVLQNYCFSKGYEVDTRTRNFFSYLDVTVVRGNPDNLEPYICGQIFDRVILESTIKMEYLDRLNSTISR